MVKYTIHSTSKMNVVIKRFWKLKSEQKIVFHIIGLSFILNLWKLRQGSVDNALKDLLLVTGQFVTLNLGLMFSYHDILWYLVSQGKMLVALTGMTFKTQGRENFQTPFTLVLWLVAVIYVAFSSFSIPSAFYLLFITSS